MDSRLQSASKLLQLPEPCLVAVLGYCADDPRSLFSAARAHSRLQQAAAVAASSIKAVRAVVTEQQQADSVLLYLAHHGQHVDSISIEKPQGIKGWVRITELPHEQLQGLSSLSCTGLALRLQPWNGSQGVLGPGVPLKQLQLHRCRIQAATLAAALAMLPQLQYLRFTGNLPLRPGGVLQFPCSVLQRLQQLTYLELTPGGLQGHEDMQGYDGLQHHAADLHALTGLQDLRLQYSGRQQLPANVLSSLQHLTQLRVQGCYGRALLEPDALAGVTQLQHLELVYCQIVGNGAAQLLPHVQHMQQLTYLDLGASICSRGLNLPAAAAVYSALTASSELQHLSINRCTILAGAWQHMFPTGRQLLHLRELDISQLCLSTGRAVAAPEASRLVSCCPGLQSLQLQRLQYTDELLAPLTGLSGLQELSLHPVGGSAEGLQVVPQLTGLRRLYVHDPGTDGTLLPQLTQLKQLAWLKYHGPLDERNSGL
jgi:hypothetical protein